MPNKHWMVAALALLVALSAMGCQTAESPDAAGAAAGEAAAVSQGDASGVAAGDAAGVAAGETGADSDGNEADAGEATVVPTSQLMVQSGAATLPAQTPVEEQERPQPQAGIQRVVSLTDAIDAVDFEVLQPNDLPETAGLQIVQLVEPPEGQESATLPAVRMIFDVDGQGVIVLLQAPATGEAADGEPKTIGGADGWSQISDQLIILTWEDGPVRYEMRGSGIDMETLERAANSLVAAGA